MTVYWGDVEREFEVIAERYLSHWIKESDENAAAFYSSLANVYWLSPAGIEIIWSFRRAAGLIAEIRNDGTTYLDWYCCGDGELVHDRVNGVFEKHGWTHSLEKRTDQ